MDKERANLKVEQRSQRNVLRVCSNSRVLVTESGCSWPNTYGW